MVTRLVLPWPPSANTHWRSVLMYPKRGSHEVRVLLSAKGRQYREAVVRAVLGDSRIMRLQYPHERLAVTITLCPPTRHKCDIDNRIKPLLDALTHAGVWTDDEQVDELHVYRSTVLKGGSAVVEINAKGD